MLSAALEPPGCIPPGQGKQLGWGDRGWAAARVLKGAGEPRVCWDE